MVTHRDGFDGKEIECGRQAPAVAFDGQYGKIAVRVGSGRAEVRGEPGAFIVRQFRIILFLRKHILSRSGHICMSQAPKECEVEKS